MRRWKPIRTVPRDGTPVMVARRYWQDEDGTYHGGAPHPVRWSQEVVCFVTVDGSSLVSQAMQCTHWHELESFDGEGTETMYEVALPEIEEHEANFQKRQEEAAKKFAEGRAARRAARLAKKVGE